ncbi:MAG: peptidoglycan-binding protein [Jiangellaceae bacterium]
MVVAEGATPFYRDLSAGARGSDVEQLQTLLGTLGLFSGDLDGRFGAGTTQAVRAWQRDLGIVATGQVAFGDVIAVGSLPAEVILGEAITVGAPVGGGEEAVLTVAAEPRFVLPLSVEQRDLVPLDAQVVVTVGENTFPATMSTATETPEGDVEIALQGESGGAVCSTDCGADIPAGRRVSFPAQVVVVPETTGPAVPVAALNTDAGGTVTVQLDDGETREVSVIASAGGIAVVDGLDAGEVVVLRAASGGDGDG